MANKNLPAKTKNLPAKGKKTAGKGAVTPETIIRGVETVGEITKGYLGVQAAKQVVEKARVDGMNRSVELDKENERLRIERDARLKEYEVDHKKAREEAEVEMKRDTEQHEQAMQALSNAELEMKHKYELKMKELDQKTDAGEILEMFKEEQRYWREALMTLPADASDERRQGIMQQIEGVRESILALHK